MSTNATSVARTRIEALLDENSFVEIGGLVCARNTDFNMASVDTPSDGVITGYGVINDNLVYIYSQDSSVLGGSIGEMHAKKIAKIYDMAMKMGAPVIGLIDSCGLRLQESTDALNGFGEMYLKQAMASGVIPQITAVFGNCGGGLAIVPSLTDFTYMESSKAKLFVNSPNTLDGNYEAKLDTASSDYQSKETGVVDFVGTEDEIFANIRELISFLPANNEEEAELVQNEDDLNRATNMIAGGYKDAAMVFADIADSNNFIEVKAEYSKEMVTGFIKLDGATVGCVGNRSVIYNEEGKEEKISEEVLKAKGCDKAAEFINFCDAFSIPVLSLTNVTGFCTCPCSAKTMSQAAARLTYAFANATVPKINIIAGKAFGTPYIVMNSKSIGADVVIAYPDTKIGCMDAAMAAKIMYEGEAADVIAEKKKEYDSIQNSSMSAAKRGYVDYIIDPSETRKYVVGAFDMLYSKREDRPARKHGVF